MYNLIYKVTLALVNHKIVKRSNRFLLSYDIRNNVYVIWYIGVHHELNFYDSCKDINTIKFQWNILMSEGGVSC